MTISEIVFDYQAVIVVYAHYQVITVASATNHRRATSTGCVNEFIIDVVYCFYLQRCTTGIDRIFTDDPAGDFFDDEIDLLCHVALLFVWGVPASTVVMNR